METGIITLKYEHLLFISIAQVTCLMVASSNFLIIMRVNGYFEMKTL